VDLEVLEDPAGLANPEGLQGRKQKIQRQ
jgi:hypothetical protein